MILFQSALQISYPFLMVLFSALATLNIPVYVRTEATIFMYFVGIVTTVHLLMNFFAVFTTVTNNYRNYQST